MVKSTSVVNLIFVITVFLGTYDAKTVAHTIGSAPQVTQTNRSIQYEERLLKDIQAVLDSLNENTLNDYVPDGSANNISVHDFQTEFDASNRSEGVEIPGNEVMKNYLSSMVVSVKAQQKIKAADDLKMFEAFSEAWIPNTVVGVYERNQSGRYRHVCSGAVINYFHVITAAACVWNESTTQVKDPGSFLVVAGRTGYPGEINDALLEPGEQRFNASHLLLPKTFTGGTRGTWQSDLAVVRLATVVKKTNYVEFIRVDWANDFSEEPITDVQEGLFMASETGLEDNIRYVNVSACVDPEHAANITSLDKRCARSTGPPFSSVNIGSPLVVYHPDTRTHYLRGVLSWAYSEHGTRVVQFTGVSDENTLRWIVEAATGLFDPPANYKELLPGFYRWNNQNKTWLEAKAFCESDGNYSYLAFPTKETEYDAMEMMFPSYLKGPMRAAWVGFSDQDTEGDVISLFGMNVENYEYPNWLDPGNVTKNEEDADCVSLASVDGQPNPGLMMNSCEERRPFICGFCLECALLDSAFGETQGVGRYLAQSTAELP